jgi:hypothetical protein
MCYVFSFMIEFNKYGNQSNALSYCFIFFDGRQCRRQNIFPLRSALWKMQEKNILATPLMVGLSKLLFPLL